MNNISLPSTMSDSITKSPGRSDLVPKTLTYGARVEDVLAEGNKAKETEPQQDGIEHTSEMVPPSSVSASAGTPTPMPAPQAPDTPAPSPAGAGPPAPEPTPETPVAEPETEPEPSVPVDFAKLGNDLRREMADFAGIVPKKGATRPLITKMLAKVIISKELDVMAADVRFQDGKDRKPGKFAGRIRDGVYLVLKGEEGKFPKFFGGRQANKISKQKLDTYFECIKDEDDFDQLSIEEMREAHIEELKEKLESMNGDLLDCKTLDDNLHLLAKVLMRHEQRDGETYEKKYLVLHGANAKTTSFGGKHANRVSDDKLDDFFSRINNKEDFAKFSRHAERREKQIIEAENELKPHVKLVASKYLEDCVLLKILLTHQHQQSGETTETKYLVLKNGEPGVSALGAKNSWQVLPGMVDAYFDEIISSNNFQMVSEMVEGSLDEIRQRQERKKGNGIGKTEQSQ